MGGGSSKKAAAKAEKVYQPSETDGSSGGESNYENVDQIADEVSFIYGENRMDQSAMANETSNLLFELIPFCGGPSSDQAEDMVIKILQSNQPLPRRPRDENGSTLLMSAATSRAHAVVQALLDTKNYHGSSFDPEVNAQNTVGQTALHIASCLDTFSYEIADMLLNAGAQFHKVDLEGCTPLHYASAGGESSIVALLLMYGAGETIDVIDCRGYTALDYACNMNHSESVQLLYDMSGGFDDEDEDIDENEHKKRFWKEFIDPQSGRAYFHNLLTGITQWEKPDCLKVKVREKIEDVAEEVHASLTKTQTTSKNFHDHNTQLLDKWRQIAWREGCRRVVNKARREQQRIALQQAKAQKHLISQGSSQAESVKEKLQLTQKELNKLRKQLESKKAQEDVLTSKQMNDLKAQLEEEQKKRTLALKELQSVQSNMKKYKEQSQWTEEELRKARQQAQEHAEKMMQAKATADQVKKMQEQNAKLQKQLDQESKLRRKYYNEVEDLKGKIRVFCRIRPLSNSEKERECKTAVSCAPETGSDLVLDRSEKGKKPFSFDIVFGPKSSQKQVFADTKKLVQSAVDGFNVCIFAYGQTGSGKTYTLSGPTSDVEKWMECTAETLPESAGIQPRAIHELYRIAKRDAEKFTMSFECTLLELYRDGLIDLFSKEGLESQEKLKIKKDSSGIVYVENSVVEKSRSAKHMLQLLSGGVEKRHVASTKMNHESSRSHLIFSVKIKSVATHKSGGSETIGKLTLVDLAGSERLGKTGATGETMKEALAINKSLSALGDVISALTSGAKHIPYRNHPLTQLMSDSLGGNAKTLMFVNASPADYNVAETESSLLYAGRVKTVKNSASKGGGNPEEIKKLQRQLAMMKKKLQEQNAK